MDISFNELRNKEVVNLSDGSRMGHLVDIVFNHETSQVVGVVVPGEKRLFKKADDIFIPLEKVRRIGEDVILVRLEIIENNLIQYKSKRNMKKQVRYVDSTKIINKNGFIFFDKRDSDGLGYCEYCHYT